jgi:hypothetical protein
MLLMAAITLALGQEPKAIRVLDTAPMEFVQQPTSPAVSSRLTSPQRCPTCTTVPRANKLAGRPGAALPRHPSPLGQAAAAAG